MANKIDSNKRILIMGILLGGVFLVGCGGPKGGAATPGAGMTEAADLTGAGNDMLGDGAEALADGGDMLDQGAETFAGAGDLTDTLDMGIAPETDVLSDASSSISPAEDIPDFTMASASDNGSNFGSSSFTPRGIDSDPGTLVAGPAMYTKNPKDAAMLDALNYAEGKPGPNQTFNYRNFTPGGDHPRKTICSGRHCSDAAGEYQIQSRTYDTYRRQAGVNGFTKPEQEKMATYLMKDVRGANPNNIHDYASFNREMGKLCREWASVRCPNGRGAYGQPTKTNQQLWQEYQRSLKERS